ncbi:Glutathione synthetase [Acropora cervicornis]|uniref:Glutathione synthetase n=1 Tax=Acropora cervicornis TaxID=6130 RepID=A0AAD9Q9L6_ACRCE|nr:Glutathione synthetase [Acropora cervicornis]
MFVIVHGEVNIYDQKMLEYRVRERNPAVKVIRRSLNDIYHRSRTDDKKCLFVDGMEVAVAYFRSGYSPNHYPTEKGPKGDLNMECCLKTVENCVLKPQREGGGNNMYGEDIRLTLLSKPENSCGDEILLNRESGFLVRTKSTEHADGGVFAGRAAFDSLYLV